VTHGHVNLGAGCDLKFRDTVLMENVLERGAQRAQLLVDSAAIGACVALNEHINEVEPFHEVIGKDEHSGLVGREATTKHLMLLFEFDELTAESFFNLQPLAHLSLGRGKFGVALIHCSQNELSLPIGWPWMAQLTDRVANSKVSSFITVDSDQRSCQRALAEAGASPDLVNKLSVIGGSALADQAKQAYAALDTKTAMPAAAATFQKRYGPSFDRDPPLNILLGWLIAILAGAQGAPFWFNVLKKLIERKP